MDNRNLNNKTGLHPSWDNWQQYINDCCQLRAEHNGYKVYNCTNCWYVVDSNGDIYETIGYHILTLFTRLSGIDIMEFRKILD